MKNVAGGKRRFRCFIDVRMARDLRTIGSDRAADQVDRKFSVGKVGEYRADVVWKRHGLEGVEVDGDDGAESLDGWLGFIAIKSSVTECRRSMSQLGCIQDKPHGLPEPEWLAEVRVDVDRRKANAPVCQNGHVRHTEPVAKHVFKDRVEVVEEARVEHDPRIIDLSKSYR